MSRTFLYRSRTSPRPRNRPQTQKTVLLRTPVLGPLPTNQHARTEPSFVPLNRFKTILKVVLEVLLEVLEVVLEVLEVVLEVVLYNGL